jgi:hypothetical protein
VELRIAVPDEHVDEHVLRPALETVTRLNERMITEGHSPTFEEALKHGVRWRAEPPGAERFDNGAIVTNRKWGDCDDLAPLACATMRTNGTDPGCFADVVRSGPNRWHAIVRRSDGTVRDPSREAGMGTLNGAGAGSIVPYMFSGPGVVGSDARPMIAMRRIVGPRGVGFDARVDLPISDTDYAISVLQRQGVASQAIIGAIVGACYAGEAAEQVDPAHIARLYAIAGILEGEDPRLLAALLGGSAVAGAIPFVYQAGSQIGNEVVGFNFGKFLKVFEPIAAKVVSFIPGVGPIASTAMDVATSVALPLLDKKVTPISAIQALASAANAVSPNPITSTISNVATALEQGASVDVKFAVYPGAHIAPAA